MTTPTERFLQQQRPAIVTHDGVPVDVAAWVEDPDRLLAQLPDLKIAFAPLPEEEADVDPGAIAPEVMQFTKESLKLKMRPTVSFAGAGMLGGVCYWVFLVQPVDAPPLYGFLIRNECVAEMSCNECDAEDQAGALQRLTPAQAAFWEYVQGDWEIPRE